MKKFIVFCLILIVTVSLGATVWYFVRDNEEFVIDMSPYVYMNVGDTLPVDARIKNAKVGSSLKISVLGDENQDSTTAVLYWNELTERLEANKGGAAIVEIRAINSDLSPVYIEVGIGDGSKDAPFYVDSEDDLAHIGTDDFPANSYYILMQDIVLSSSIKPICNDSSFNGTFNGNGYTISGLNISDTEADGVKHAGLFSKIGSNGVVTSLTLSNVNISGQFETCGAFAGQNYGTITRCNVIGGEVKSSYQNEDAGANVGGICGEVIYSNASVGRIDRCFADVNVKGTKNIGGICGQNNGGIIINSYVKQSANNVVLALKDNSNVGGLVGLVCYNGDSNQATIKNCYALANIEKDDTYTASNYGLVIGNNSEPSKFAHNNLMGVYTEKSLNASLNAVGTQIDIFEGLTEEQKQQKASDKANFRGVYDNFVVDAEGKIDKSLMLSYVAAVVVNGTDKIYWDFENVWMIGTEHKYPVLNKLGANVSDEIYKYKDESKISNYSDLVRAMSAISAGNGESYYILVNNIEIPAGTEFAPATKSFAGIFEGNNKYISGINISTSVINNSSNKAGLFLKTTSNALIQNLTIKNIKIAEGATTAGAIVAENGGVIKNCTVIQNEKIETEANIVASVYVGGICGINSGTIDNCRVENQTIVTKNSKEDQERFVGGISGLNGASNSSLTATIKNSCVVTSCIKDDFNKTEFDSNLNFNFKNNFSNIKYYVGGISGANFYLITKNYVFETNISANEFSKYGAVAGISALTRSDALLNADTSEICNNKLIGGSISGYIAAGIACEQYGKVEFNQIGCANETQQDSEGNKVGFTTLVKGAEIAGLSNKLYIGARLFNCFVNVRLYNTLNGTGKSAGICNVNDYYASQRWFGEQSVYGEFGQIISICTFENNTYRNNRYDCTMDYRKETSFLRTDRDTGYGNNLIWVETGNAWHDDSPERSSFNDSRQMNVTWLASLDDIRISATNKTLAELAINYGFDQSAWDFVSVGDYPKLTNLPEILEIEE